LACQHGPFLVGMRDDCERLRSHTAPPEPLRVHGRAIHGQIRAGPRRMSWAQRSLPHLKRNRRYTSNDAVVGRAPLHLAATISRRAAAWTTTLPRIGASCSDSRRVSTAIPTHTAMGHSSRPSRKHGGRSFAKATDGDIAHGS